MRVSTPETLADLAVDPQERLAKLAAGFFLDHLGDVLQHRRQDPALAERR